MNKKPEGNVSWKVANESHEGLAGLLDVVPIARVAHSSMTWDTISIRHPPSNDRAPPPSRMGLEKYRFISKLQPKNQIKILQFTLFQISQPNMAIRWSVFQCSLLCAYTKSSNKQTALSVLRAIWVPLISSWLRPCKPGRPIIWWNSAIWRLARWIWRDSAPLQAAGDSKKPRRTFFECHAC